MAHKVTMQDIANELGITKVSVSKALNDQPGVSGMLRKQVRETAESMGYVLNRTMTDGQKMHFAFVVPKRFFLETDNFYNIIYYYLNKICMNAGHQLTCIVLNTKEEENNIFPEAIMLDDVNGFFLGGEIADGYLDMLSKTNLPLVAIDFYKTFLDVDYILTDNYYLGYYAAEYLIKRGHKEIGFVGNISQTTSIYDRYFGYLKAMHYYGLPVADNWVISNNDIRTGVYTLGVELPEKLPTAFVCHCDMAAYFLMNSLNKLGKEIPEDVSLISFDNTELSRTMAPQLTSFDIDRKEIAKISFQTMVKLLRGEKRKNRHYISAALVERDSVNPIEN